MVPLVKLLDDISVHNEDEQNNLQNILYTSWNPNTVAHVAFMVNLAMLRD